MKRLALVALALALGLALLVAAGCGGDKVPQGAIATVGGVPITKAQFDQYINQAKASAGQNGQPAFPSPGTTTYNSYAAEIVNYLVEQQVVLNAAAKDKITVTDAEVQSQLQAIAAQYGGTQKMYAAAKKAGMDPAQLKTYIKNSLSGQKLYQKIIGNVAPDRRPRCRPTTRPTRAPSTSRPRAPCATCWSRPRPRLSRCRPCWPPTTPPPTGSRWPRSTRSTPAPRSSGGNLGPIHKGQMVKPFENAAFAAKLDTVSAPVHSQYGWHVLEVTKITPAKKSTFASAEASIKSTLTSQMQDNTWKSWLAKQQKAATILYAAGFNPDKLTASPSPAPSASSSK